jgi:hypothetical protein
MTYLQDLCQQMSDLDHKYNDHQFMMHVMSGLGDDYEYVVYNLDHRLMTDPPMLTIDSFHDELSIKYEKLRHKYKKEPSPIPAFTMAQPNLNQNDAIHDEMNAIYAGNQAVPLYSNPPSPIPYTSQPPHPMANMYMNQYHESMLYAGGSQGCCNTSSMYGHKLGWFLQITVTVFFGSTTT